MLRTESSADVRYALMQMLISEMEESFTRVQEQACTNGKEELATSEEELELLVREAIRMVRCN